MNSFSLVTAAFRSPPGTSHYVSTLINDRAAEPNRWAVSPQDASVLAPFPGINIRDNYNDFVSLLDF